MDSWNPAVIAINGYQRYISPHKGFCCAYRVVTGEDSCSEYVKKTIIRKGFFRSLTEIRNRFQDCKESARYINKAKEAEASNKQKEDDDSPSDGACIAAETVACLPTSCAEASLSSAAGTLGGIASGGCDGCACTPF